MVEPHYHEGQNSPPIDIKDILGKIEVVSSVPTEIPLNKIKKQFLIFNDGTTKGFYIYDFTNSVWLKIAGITQNVVVGANTLHFTNGILTSIT